MCLAYRIQWNNKKYHHDDKKRLRHALYPGEWKFELVVHRVKYPEELELLKKHNTKVHHLDEIADSLSKSKTMIKRAAGSDLLELIMLGRENE